MSSSIALSELQLQYDSVCTKFIEFFCEKQEIDFDGWVGDEVGGLAGFDTKYFFNFADIIFDLNSDQPKRLIINWQDDTTDYSLFNENPRYINYKSYARGLRYATSD